MRILCLWRYSPMAVLAGQVRNIIIDCAVELSPKTAVYATLVGEPLITPSASIPVPSWRNVLKSLWDPILKLW